MSYLAQHLAFCRRHDDEAGAIVLAAILIGRGCGSPRR